MRRYLRLLAIQMRVSLAAAMAYRANFVIEGLMSAAWLGLTLLPLLVLYHARQAVNGWDAPSALVVMAYFWGLRALLEGVVSPSLGELIEQIRSGAFDYVLLKPVDAQLAVSASRYEPWKAFDFAGAVALVVWAFIQRGHPPSAKDLGLGVLLFGVGAAAMYSLWIAAAAASFWVVRLDNLLYLLGAVFDTARWPVYVFPGVWRLLFTFVVPVAIMTTFPAMALLGSITIPMLAGSLAGAAVMLASRALWRLALANYTSASS